MSTRIEAIGKLVLRESKRLGSVRINPEFEYVSKAAQRLIRDIDLQPHAFVIGCVVDQQINASDAWEMPLKLKREFGGFSIRRLVSIGLEEWQDAFVRLRLHRHPKRMAQFVYKAVQRINSHYGGDASRIWMDPQGPLSSATIVRRFLEFEGIGLKIATMATNILVRKFNVPVLDKRSIDISPDRHVARIFKRLGLIDNQTSLLQIVYAAREISPDYPGVIDQLLWEHGRNCCREQRPLCDGCFLRQVCEFPQIKLG